MVGVDAIMSALNTGAVRVYLAASAPVSDNPLTLTAIAVPTFDDANSPTGVPVTCTSSAPTTPFNVATPVIVAVVLPSYPLSSAVKPATVKALVETVKV